MQASKNEDLLMYTTEIVSAYVSQNTLAAEGIPSLIDQVFSALSNVSNGQNGVDKKVARPLPAVPIKRSVQPDYIVCLEDGKQLKMLKRYLKTTYDMTPDEYRERWGLPADYPMTAPSYAAKRSQLAKEIGLGKKK